MFVEDSIFVICHIQLGVPNKGSEKCDYFILHQTDE